MGKKRKQRDSSINDTNEGAATVKLIDLSSSAATSQSNVSANSDDLGVHIIERPAGFSVPDRETFNNNISGGDSDSDSSDSLSFSINSEFAEKFESSKRAQELSKKSQRGKKSKLSEIVKILQNNKNEDSGDDDSDDSDDSEDEDEDDDGELLTSAIDAKISETLLAIETRDPRLYKKDENFFTEAEIETQKTQKNKEKEIKVKDAIIAEIIQENKSESDDDDEDINGGNDKNSPLTFVEEQKKLKRDFLQSASLVDEGEEENLFKVKIRAADSLGENSSESLSAPNSGSPDSDFLRSYMSNQWWRAKDESMLPSYQQIKGEAPPQSINDEEDEEEFDRAENFESRYNFRFEESGGSSIITHPRQIIDSLRKVDTKRKLTRERRKAAKLEERQRRDEEIKKIKNQKLREIKEKAEKINKVAGIDNSNVDELNLDGDWDEEQHQKLMEKMFSEEYYEQENFDDEKIIQEIVDEENKEEKQNINKFAIKRELDSLYNLDYEDIIGGGLKTRFKYRQVQPDSFGLSVDEILNREDKELNKKVSLKKIIAPYNNNNNNNENYQQNKHKNYSQNYQTSKTPKLHEQQKSKQTSAKPSPEKISHSGNSNKKSPEQEFEEKAEKSNKNSQETLPSSSASSSSSQPLSAAQKRRMREKKRKSAGEASVEENVKRTKI